MDTCWLVDRTKWKYFALVWGVCQVLISQTYILCPLPRSEREAAKQRAKLVKTLEEIWGHTWPHLFLPFRLFLAIIVSVTPRTSYRNQNLEHWITSRLVELLSYTLSCIIMFLVHGSTGEQYIVLLQDCHDRAWNCVRTWMDSHIHIVSGRASDAESTVLPAIAGWIARTLEECCVSGDNVSVVILLNCPTVPDNQPGQGFFAYEIWSTLGIHRTETIIDNFYCIGPHAILSCKVRQRNVLR